MAFLGKKPNNIFEPSRGGIGIKLKIAKTTLIKTTNKESSTKELAKFRVSENLINKPKIKATMIFDSGPAKATKTSPHLLFFKL